MKIQNLLFKVRITEFIIFFFLFTLVNTQIIIAKPNLQPNPLQHLSLPGEVISDKVLKARQGLLLLKSKMNRQKTFSNFNLKPVSVNCGPIINTK